MPEGSGIWFASAEELARKVVSGCRLGVGGVHFTRAPTALLKAVVERAEVKDLTYVAWGGGLPLEVLLAHNLVGKAELCFSGMDIYGLARRFRRAAENGSIEVVDYTALRLISGLRASAENLDWEVMQQPAGSSVTAGLIGPVDSDRVPMVKAGRLDVDVMLLHAQRADDAGNIEIAGARATDLSTVFAAKAVLVTVEERVPVGDLGTPRAFILPRSHVTGVAVAPFGAFPTSCLPYYTAHYPSLRTSVDAAVDDLDAMLAAPTPEVASEVTGYARWTPVNPALLLGAEAPPTDLDASPTIDETMTWLIAASVTNDSVCSFGSAALVPAAAYLLAKASHAPRALLMSQNGGFVDIAVRPMSLSFGEAMDFRSAAAHTGGDETYHWYYQPGRITLEVVGAAQIDASGATNNLWISKADGTRIRLPGQGGMADVANLHRNFLIYIPRQSPRNTVAAVEMISARRQWADADLRARYGLSPGKVEVITDYGAMAPNERTGLLEITALHPGRTVGQFQSVTGFSIEPAADLVVTSAPSDEHLAILRNEIDPLGVRKLDFLASGERAALIDSILASERAVFAATCKTAGPPR